MSAATRRWMLPACQRTEERTATTTSCHVRAAVCYIHSNLLQVTQRRTNQCKSLCQTSLRPLIKETATVSMVTVSMCKVTDNYNVLIYKILCTGLWIF